MAGYVPVQLVWLQSWQVSGKLCFLEAPNGPNDHEVNAVCMQEAAPASLREERYYHPVPRFQRQAPLQREPSFEADTNISKQLRQKCYWAHIARHASR